MSDKYKIERDLSLGVTGRMSEHDILDDPLASPAAELHIDIDRVHDIVADVAAI